VVDRSHAAACARSAAENSRAVGAKGLPAVSMCQMASVSLRAMSTQVNDGPRWRPSRVLVR
jgi:hypothetical protein